MAFDVIVTLLAAFLCVALVAGYAASTVLAAISPDRRRLRHLTLAGPVPVVESDLGLVDAIDPRLRRLPGVPRSPKEMGRLRRRLATAGYHRPEAVFVFSMANLVTPGVFAIAALAFVGMRQGWIFALLAAAMGYLLPGMLLERKTELRKRDIRNGLPDALDLLIVCVEAGCGLDLAVIKTADELGLTHSDLAYELRLVTTEIRAGKSRIEAFKNFAARTKVDDVRSLVSLLVQTDKFGTSVAQALRTHADASRTKRRQEVEERAAKLGVKLVFPLALLLFPPLFIVLLGPVVITFVRTFAS
jgi:tight adherence protein C